MRLAPIDTVTLQPSLIATALQTGGQLHALAQHGGKRFLVYQLRDKPGQPGKRDKVPVWPVKWGNDAELLTAEEALAKAQEMGEGHGVGIVLAPSEGGGFVCIDLDNCIDVAGNLSELARYVLALFPGAAVERSSSGRGLHIWLWSKPIAHSERPAPGLEIYGFRSRHFIALTGYMVGTGNPFQDFTGGLTALVATYPGTSASPTLPPVEWTDAPREVWSGPEDDDALLELAKSRQPSQTAAQAFGGEVGKASFAALWDCDRDALAAVWPSAGSEGDGIDHSSADMSLASRLAYWTGCNPVRMERLMRGSGLARDKWDRGGYLERTIEAAIASCAKVHGQPTGEAPAPCEQTAAVPSFTPVDLSGVMRADPPAVGFAVRPLFPRRHVTLLGGHGGIGKSSLALTLCAHVAAGTPWAGHEVEQCRVAFASLEDEGELVTYRLRRIIGAYQLDHAAIVANLTVLDGTRGPTALFVEGEGHTRRGESTASLRALQEAVAGAGLVVVDNASDAYDADENKRRDVRAFIRELAEIAKANDAAVVLLAHIDKSAARGGANGNSYSGSTAWHNSARSRLALVEEDGRIELRQEKLNLGKKAAPVALTFADHGVLMPAGTASPTDRAAADAETVLALLRSAIKADATVATAESGPSTAWKILQRLPEFPHELAVAGRGKQRFDAAMMQLQRERRIEREEYRTTARKLKERWRVVEIAKIAGGENTGDDHKGEDCAPV